MVALEIYIEAFEQNSHLFPKQLCFKLVKVTHCQSHWIVNIQSHLAPSSLLSSHWIQHEHPNNSKSLTISNSIIGLEDFVNQDFQINFSEKQFLNTQWGHYNMQALCECFHCHLISVQTCHHFQLDVTA